MTNENEVGVCSINYEFCHKQLKYIHFKESQLSNLCNHITYSVLLVGIIKMVNQNIFKPNAKLFVTLFLLTQFERFLTIHIISRYTAICHPLKPSLHSGKRRTIYIIVAIWIFCMMPSAWWLVYGKVRDLNLVLQMFLSYETLSLSIHSKVMMSNRIFIVRFNICFTTHGRKIIMVARTKK